MYFGVFKTNFDNFIICAGVPNLCLEYFIFELFLLLLCFMFFWSCIFEMQLDKNLFIHYEIKSPSILVLLSAFDYPMENSAIDIDSYYYYYCCRLSESIRTHARTHARHARTHARTHARIHTQTHTKVNTKNIRNNKKIKSKQNESTKMF